VDILTGESKRLTTALPLAEDIEDVEEHELDACSVAAATLLLVLLLLLLLRVLRVVATIGGESIEEEDRACNITTGEDTAGNNACGGGVGVAR